MVKILKFGWNSEIWLKFWNLVEILKFGWNCEIWSKFWNLVEILKFGWNSEIWSKFWNLVEILKFGWNSEIWSNFWKDGQNSENSWLGMVCMVWFGFEGSKFQHSHSPNMVYQQGGHRAARAAKKGITYMKKWKVTRAVYFVVCLNWKNWRRRKGIWMVQKSMDNDTNQIIQPMNCAVKSKSKFMMALFNWLALLYVIWIYKSIDPITKQKWP